MLELAGSKQEKSQAQVALRKILQRALPTQGKHNVGYPGGNTTIELFSKGNGDIWFGGNTSHDARIPRYWNAFGLFDPTRAAQTITVELNIPINTNGQHVSGFFARDKRSKKVYLMHTGKIGGGARGIGKSAFLAWSRNQLVSVFDEETESERFGIVIGALDNSTLLGRIRNFVLQVATFKERVREGQLDTPEFRKRVEEFERFKPEFSGRKAGYSGRVLDYFSYHGDVISELHRRRTAAKSPAEVIFNSGLIDLAVRNNGILTEVYEAKTSTGRQALYTAIGQLMVHSGGESKARKFLIVPENEDFPDDLKTSLHALEITVWRFSLNADGSGVTIES